MKQILNKITVVLIVLISTQQINAQNGKEFYLSLNTGYNIGTGPTNFGAAYSFQIIEATETSSGIGTQEIPRINLGEGFKIGLNGGYMFNKNIGLELGVYYLISSSISTHNTSYSGEYNNKEISSNMLQIKPSIVFRAGFEKINPYAKIGMLIGSGTIWIDTDQKQGTDTFKSTVELNDGIPIGFQSGLGILYKINDKFSLFGELDLISLSYGPKKGTYTKFEANGEDVLSTMTVQNREFEFIEKDNSGNPSLSTEPSKVPKVPFSYNSIGFNIGVQYQF